MNTNRYSWIILQLCWALIISSFNLKPVSSKIFITSKDKGIIWLFFLVSPRRGTLWKDNCSFSFKNKIKELVEDLKIK